MRFIVTNSTKVEQLKKQAKKLQRAAGGKHTELLDRVARSSGYDHWHHVVKCLEATAAKQEQLSLRGEAEAIVNAALEGVGKCVMTGPEASARTPFVLFSTSDGDAWLLEADEGLAACLCWHGNRRETPVRESAGGVEVEWDGSFELLAELFHVETSIPEIRTRSIAGYPIDDLRSVLLRAQSVEREIADIFMQADAVDLDDQVVGQLLERGWKEADLRAAQAAGARYSPGRNSLIYPPVGSDEQEA